MSGPVDPRTVKDNQPATIKLGLGLDQTSPAGSAQPGSLRDCLNVEVVHGHLEQTMGVLSMGGFTNNGVETFYIAKGGTAGVDYTLTGVFNTKEIVRWYPDSTSLNTELGVGIMLPAPVYEQYAITAVVGAAPDGNFYIVGDDSGATYTVDTDDGRFEKFHESYTNVHQGSAWQLAQTMGANSTSSEVWDAFRPGPLAVRDGRKAGISHIFQCNDNLYAVSDFVVMAYASGTSKPAVGDKLHFDYPNATGPIAYVARVEETAGDWSNGDSSGWLYLYPQSDSTIASLTLDNLYYLNNDVIQNLTAGIQCASTPVQTGNYDVQVHKHHGQLWKLDTDGKLNTGWRWLNPGYSIRFGNSTAFDQTAPNTQIAPLFVSDGISTLADTGFLDFATPNEIPVSGGGYGAWSNLANLKADDGTNATCSMSALAESRKLEFPLGASSNIPDDANITGIEVKIEANGSFSGTLLTTVVELTNDAAADNGIDRVFYTSENRAKSTDILATSPTVYTYGGDLDLWGFESIDVADWNAGNIELNLQFVNTDPTTPRSITLDYVWIKVYYTVNAKNVYFRNLTGSDLTTGTLITYQLFDGEWSTDNAKGWMAFSDIDDPTVVQDGCLMFTEPNGTGDFLGEVLGFSMNSFPSMEEMKYANTRSRTLISSLASEDGNQTAYCVNGVGPAWAIDKDDRVRFIRLPVAPDKDAPRYVEEHRNHLMLALKEHIVVSSIATPDNMNTADGATTWHLRDRITGLHHTTDGTTIILCRDSIHQFQGAAASGQDPFAMSTVTNRGGAKDYSSVEMGEIYFLTSHGLSSIAATDKFGNFDAATLSRGVEDWLRDRLRDSPSSFGTTGPGAFMDAIPVKAKNQIRFYFRDGMILTATLDPEGQLGPQFTFQHYGAEWQGTPGTAGGPWASGLVLQPGGLDEDHYAPTALWSGFTSWGEERLYFGKRGYNPEVMRLDCGSINRQGSSKTYAGDTDSYFELNPIMIGQPFDTPSHMEKIVVAWDGVARASVAVNTGVDFNAPTILGWTTTAPGFLDDAHRLSAAADAVNVPLQNQYSGTRKPFIGTCHINNTAYAHSIMIATRATWAALNTPQRFISVTPHVQPRERRARLQSTTLRGTSIPRE